LTPQSSNKKKHLLFSRVIALSETEKSTKKKEKSESDEDRGTRICQASSTHYLCLPTKKNTTRHSRLHSWQLKT